MKIMVSPASGSTRYHEPYAPPQPYEPFPPSPDAPNVSIVSNGKDVTWSGIDASEGRDFEDVVVTLTNNHATLSGRVTDTRAVRGTIAVIAFPVNRARWSNYGWDPPDFRAGRVRADGSAEHARLGAGQS